METIIVDSASFIITLIVFIAIKPFANQIVIKAISNYRLLTRIKKVSNSNRGLAFVDEEEEEDIGLNKKGPKFRSSMLFNFIAEKNKNLIEEMQELLLKAGNRQDSALEEFMKSKFTAAISLFFIVLLILSTNDFGIPHLASYVISIILAILGGHKLTNLNLSLMASKRKDAIENGVPDLIDLLVICTESGLDLNRSIRRIARELRTSNPILADELSLTAIELEMIPDHKQVFNNLENRTDCLQIKTLSKTLSQSIEYGSSLSVTLKDLAVESRQKRMLTAEAKAAQAPTLLTLPMMFCTMPCLFIVMLGPVIIGMIKSFNGGS
ncbi:MAG: type II secretion system F family protein [Holosporaceae bacterium]|jgi:tight adherence protein C|nr:type II secretion system F family protein [Holosporaceae bacterium]